jgi:hypothetical protein
MRVVRKPSGRNNFWHYSAREILQCGCREGTREVTGTFFLQCNFSQSLTAVVADLTDSSFLGKHTPEKLPMFNRGDFRDTNSEHLNLRTHSLERRNDGSE